MPSWGHLGVLLGASWGHLGLPGCSKLSFLQGRSFVFSTLAYVDLSSHLLRFLGSFGAVLGTSWRRAEVSWGFFWAILGSSWAHLGSSWGHLGDILGPSWCWGLAKRFLGLSWVRRGPILGRLGVILGLIILGPSWGRFGPSGGNLEAICGPSEGIRSDSNRNNGTHMSHPVDNQRNPSYAFRSIAGQVRLHIFGNRVKTYGKRVFLLMSTYFGLRWVS